MKSLSPQQLAAQQWVKTAVFNGNKSNHAVVIAVAGAGKTTLMTAVANDMLNDGRKGNVAMVAFSAAIAAELKERIGFIRGIFIKTAHGFGLDALKSHFPWLKCTCPPKNCKHINEKAKVKAVADQFKIPQELFSFVFKLLKQAKNSAFGINTDIENRAEYLNLISRHNLASDIDEIQPSSPLAGYSQLDLLEMGIDLVRQILTAEINQGLSNRLQVIDFEDMVWLPLVLNIHMWTYKWLAVDEVQDTNPVNLALYRKMLAPSGRFMGVGDPKQAIFAFRGADSKSIETIKKAFKAIEIPLTVSFRCPKAVIKVAQQYGVDYIQAHDSAPEGLVAEEGWQDLIARKDLSADDAVLCRNVAPLLRLQMMLFANGIPAHVLGKHEIGERLIKLSRRWKSVKTIGQLRDKLESYRQAEIQKALAAGEESNADMISDMVDALLLISDSLPIDGSIDLVASKLESMFDDHAKTIKLSTIHKSKGKEWDRVFWYGLNRYQPSPFARQEWQLEAEENLCYVAATRSKDVLIFVDAPTKDEER